MPRIGALIAITLLSAVAVAQCGLRTVPRSQVCSCTGYLYIVQECWGAGTACQQSPVEGFCGYDESHEYPCYLPYAVDYCGDSPSRIEASTLKSGSQGSIIPTCGRTPFSNRQWLDVSDELLFDDFVRIH